MADKAVPELDRVVGYYLETAPGQVEFQTYSGPASTWKLALIDLLKNPKLRRLYFRSGGDIWLELPLF